MSEATGKHSIYSENPEIAASQEAAGYCDATVAGDTVYLSGVVSFLAEGETDMEAAFVRTFERLGRTLERLGLSWQHVVALDTFHTDLLGQNETFIKVKHRYIKAPYPAWTGIGIAQLARPNALVEIKLTAWKG